MKIGCFLGKHDYKIEKVINTHAVKVKCKNCGKEDIVTNPFSGIFKFKY